MKVKLGLAHLIQYNFYRILYKHGGRWEDGRLVPQTGGEWEVGPTNRWEMGGWSHKQVGDGRLVPQTGGGWEVGPTNRWQMGGWFC